MISQKGIDLIKHFEGLYLEAYKCPADVWTIGYGHTIGVEKGQIITNKQADNFLRQDLGACELHIDKNVSVKINQNQRDALASFIFNLGGGNFKSSTLLKRINEGLYTEAANEFLKWNKAGGKVLEGLTKRRLAEKELFLDQA